MFDLSKDVLVWFVILSMHHSLQMFFVTLYVHAPTFQFVVIVSKHRPACVFCIMLSMNYAIHAMMSMYAPKICCLWQFSQCTFRNMCFVSLLIFWKPRFKPYCIISSILIYLKNFISVQVSMDVNCVKVYYCLPAWILNMIDDDKLYLRKYIDMINVDMDDNLASLMAFSVTDLSTYSTEMSV